jgi:trehalose 6-phosphate phosphatase
VGGIAYAGSHGAELLEPGDRKATTLPEFERFGDQVRRFAEGHDGEELRSLGVRLEDKGPIAGLHWRGAQDEDAAEARLREIARVAEEDGLATHWGRKVLEVRPPVPVTKARAVEELVRRSGVRTAMFGGDDTTDLDAFDALDSAVEEGRLDAAVRVGVASDEGPAAIVDRADLVVLGSRGFIEVLTAL